MNNNGNANGNNNKNNTNGVVAVVEIDKKPYSIILKDSYTYEEILKAYFDCRRRKRSKNPAVYFESNFEKYLYTLLDEINSGTYKVGVSKVFVITYPKVREVWAASFRDRIVHHLLYNHIGIWFEKHFITDTYSCIKGRGTSAASDKAIKYLRKVTQNWSTNAWCLQLDIANFFVSINRNTLWNCLEKYIGTESTTARITKQIVFNDPTRNYICTTPDLLQLVPKHKSLLSCSSNYGLPIGNLTSQSFSNIYLDAFDKYMKHILKIKYYIRYVDDILILSKDKEELEHIREIADEWLLSNRELHFHPNKVHLFPANQTINFVGRIIKPFRSYPRRMVCEAANKKFTDLTKNPLDKKLLSACNSYLGILKSTNTYKYRSKLCSKIDLPTIITPSVSKIKLIRI